MKKLAFICCLSVLLSVGNAGAELTGEESAKLQQGLDELYSKPGMRDITEICRKKGKEIGESALNEFINENFEEGDQQSACSMGAILYRAGKSDDWTTKDVIEGYVIFINSKEYKASVQKANCSALRSDTKNYKTSLEAYFAGHMEYPKIANFNIGTVEDPKNSFSYLGKDTKIVYKPSKNLQKYTVTARSSSCSKTYVSSSSTYKVTEAKKVRNK